MSFPGISLAKAEVEAQTIVDVIGRYCTRIEVAGSIRRRKKIVNDIDIVLVWEGAGFGFATFCRKYRIVPTGGARIIKFKWGNMRIPVQLFQTDEARWPSELLIRTGSADHNKMLCARARAHGLKLSVAEGVITTGYPVTAVPDIKTEHDIFEALKMKYAEPKDRR